MYDSIVMSAFIRLFAKPEQDRKGNAKYALGPAKRC